MSRCVADMRHRHSCLSCVLVALQADWAKFAVTVVEVILVATGVLKRS